MSEELKPCPFCGSKECSPNWHNHQTWVECDTCRAKGRHVSSPWVRENRADSEMEAAYHWNTRAELAALKAGQGEAVAEFGSDCIFNLRKQPNGERWPAGTKLYTAPPAPADAVSVPVELLERTISNLLYGSARDNADELRALLAQSESKGVKP